MATVFEVRDEIWEVVEPMIPPVKVPERQGRRPVELDEEYGRLADAAENAHRQNQSGRDATTKVADDPQACPADGASSAQDTNGDVKIADGMKLAEQQPGSHDLISVTHNTDGSSACFELRFAADAPEEGGVGSLCDPTASASRCAGRTAKRSDRAATTTRPP